MSETNLRFARMDALTPRQTDMVEELFHGDGTCSIGNMNVACFASERCNKPRATGTGEKTMSSMARNTFVTLEDEEVIAFASMMSMAHCRFLNMTQHPQTGMLISNLCVRESERTHGHGRRMLEFLTRNTPEPVYVSVRRPDPDASAEVLKVMTARCDRLLHMYQKLAFDVVEKTDTFYIMKKR